MVAVTRNVETDDQLSMDTLMYYKLWRQRVSVGRGRMVLFEIRDDDSISLATYTCLLVNLPVETSSTSFLSSEERMMRLIFLINQTLNKDKERTRICHFVVVWKNRTQGVRSSGFPYTFGYDTNQ